MLSESALTVETRRHLADGKLSKWPNDNMAPGYKFVSYSWMSGGRLSLIRTCIHDDQHAFAPSLSRTCIVGRFWKQRIRQVG